VRYHLALAAVTGNDEHLAHAVAAGAHLLATMTGPGWPMPAGYGIAEGTMLFGYAHGAAGIGDAMVDLARVTGDERWALVARDVALDLAGRALPALDDGTGADWVTADGGERLGPFWCHGAAGIGRFLLRAADLTEDPGLEATALAAVRSAARGARWAAPGQCHGLAGNADVVLDAYLATGDRAWLGELDALARLLRPFVVGLDDAARLSPGFATGRAGMLAYVQRLGAAAPGPHVLDLAALGRGAPVPAGGPR
jgi:lantibiotic modifying enzyme